MLPWATYRIPNTYKYTFFFLADNRVTNYYEGKCCATRDEVSKGVREFRALPVTLKLEQKIMSKTSFLHHNKQEIVF